MKDLADSLIARGVGTLGVSLAVYLVMCVVAGVRALLNLNISPVAFAVPMFMMMVGALLSGIGLVLAHHDRRIR